MKNTTTSNPVRGLGNDIIEISRMRQSIERHGAHFLERLFSRKEQDYCLKFKDPAPHFAGKFAAKESIVKALGTGFGADVSWHDIEILNNDRGRPEVLVSDKIMKLFDQPKLLVSISHCHEYAAAVAIWAN